MKRAIVAALVLLPGTAFGQSYQTALPLSPAEKVALEAQLSTVLDYAGAGEATNIVLPTGRVATVRTYQSVRQGGRPPCRGYRIDLQGRGSRTAVDGFRCRQSAGAWAIAEPEIVLAQESAARRPADDVIIVEEGGPLDLRGGLLGNELTVVVPDGVSPDPLPGRLPSEPLYPGDDAGLGESLPGTPPPVPRPAPRGALAAAPLPDTIPAPLTTARPAAEETSEPLAPAADAEAEEPRPVAAPATETPADETPAAETPEVTTVARAEEGTTVIPPTTGVTRVASTAAARTVGTREQGSELPDYAADERVTAALQDLDYLDAGAPTPEAVAAAVDEFARDERFALPVSPDTLMERLTAALDRSETVALCDAGDSPVCVAR